MSSNDYGVLEFYPSDTGVSEPEVRADASAEIGFLLMLVETNGEWMQLSILSILAKPWLKLVVIFYFLYLHWIIAKRS